MIRHFLPGRILEVGSGYSTLAARLAKAGRLECIEPFPQPWLHRVADRLIVSPVQDVPLSEFESLEANDILFIDSTHVAKIGSDVVFVFLQVLPRLKAGVVVHVHDIFLPFETPRSWVKDLLIFWNEQYLLGAYLAHNRDWEVLAANHWLGRTQPEAMLRLFPMADPPGGSSFWMRRVRD
jgi:hypothetical protein